MANSVAIANLSELFDSQRYSDATLTFATNAGYPCRLYAHKMVLGQASDYFKALLESGFKEASAPTIELIGDDWCAVYGLIAHFYGLHYDGHNECSLEPLTVTSDDRGAAYVVYQVDLYVVASKYLVPSLCSAIKSDLEHMLD